MVPPPTSIVSTKKTSTDQQSIKSVASSKQPSTPANVQPPVVKQQAAAQSFKQLPRNRQTHSRQIRQVRYQDYGHQLPSSAYLSYSPYSEIPHHKLLLHPHEYPDSAGVSPVIRDVQPVIPWSYPFGSLPYKFNHCKFNFLKKLSFF